ncbi:MAG: hypothetical protein RLZZ301_293 [Bacteroidota bacterium]|jgi:hypothetical protein
MFIVLPSEIRIKMKTVSLEMKKIMLFVGKICGLPNFGHASRTANPTSALSDTASSVQQ